MRGIGILLPEEIKSTLDKIFSHLGALQIESGDHAGWHNKLGSGVIGNVATAQMLLAFKEFGRDIPKCKECLESLQSEVTTVSWNGSSLAGWPYITVGPRLGDTGFPSTVPTAWILLALCAMKVPTDNDCRQIAVKYLRSTVRRVGQNMAWGLIPWGEPLVYPTSVAIRALVAAGEVDCAEPAYRWLLEARSSEGVGWGAKARSLATTAHTACAVLALNCIEKAPKHEAYLAACRMLRERLEGILGFGRFAMPSSEVGDVMHGWVEDMEFPASTGVSATRLAHCHMPFDLAAAALSKDEANGDIVEAMGIQTIKRWHHKLWRHPHYPMDDRSWVFHDCLMSLAPMVRGFYKKRPGGIFYAAYPGGALVVLLGMLEMPYRKLLWLQKRVRMPVFLIIMVGLVAGVAGWLIRRSGVVAFLSALVTAMVAKGIVWITTRRRYE